MDLVKLKASTKSYIWGGKKLFGYGKDSSESTIAESWELSFHDAGLSLVDSGLDKGRSLREVATKEDIGSKADSCPFFPILIKLIDAMDDLSIQVHPSDEYALKNENSFGKTEMWYVVEAEKGAMLHIGLNRDITKEEFEQKIKNNTILDVMNHIEVKPGDCYFIPSGTLHAIGKGCFICEIQENSNLTYRVYDYDRRDKEGKARELHVDKALKVTNLNRTNIENLKDKNPLADCNYFKVTKLVNPKEITAKSQSFKAITILDGEGNINGIPFSKGSTFFLPANKSCVIEGDCVAIQSEM